MKKKLLAVISAISLLVAFAGCSKKPQSESTSPSTSAPQAVSSVPASSSSIAVESASALKVAPVNSADLGETLGNAISVMVDGASYTFPGTTFADLEANGWTIDPGADGATLPANTITRVDYFKGDFKISLSAANTATAPLPMNECEVAGLMIDSSDSKEMAFALPGGIAFGASPEEVEAAYGATPDFYDTKEGERLSLEYKMEDSKIKFQFYKGGISGVDIRC